MSSVTTDDLGSGADFMLFSLQTHEVVSSRRASRRQFVPLGRYIHLHPIQNWMWFMFQVVHIGVKSDQIETRFCVPAWENIRVMIFHKREEHITSKSGASLVSRKRLVVKQQLRRETSPGMRRMEGKLRAQDRRRAETWYPIGFPGREVTSAQGC